MKSRPLAALLTFLVVASTAAHGQRPEAPRTVSVRFDAYQQLVERKRDAEERLGRDGARALDLVIAKAHYDVKFGDVKFGAESAAVTARFQLKTLKADGWKLVPLVGGGVSVSKFTPPQEGALLVLRDMLPSLAATLSPGTHYLLTEGKQDGELTLEFLVPVVVDGGVRRAQWLPPAVPLSTLEATAPASDGNLSLEPIARLDEVPGQAAGLRRIRASVRGGEPLTVVLAKAEAPVTPASGAPGQPPAPAAELVVDQLHAHWSLSDARIRLRERLVVDVRGGTLTKLVLRKPTALANVQVREDAGSTLLEESSVGKALDPEGRQETIELKLRAPVQGRLVRLALTADLRAEPDSAALTLAPITVDGARSIIEGYAAVSSLLPHAVTLEKADGAQVTGPERLPASFSTADGPLVLVAALTAPAPVLQLKQAVQARPRPITGAVQKLDIVTDLAANTVRSRYRAQVSPGPDGTVVVTLPDGNGWALEEVRGTASADISMIRQGSYLLRLKPGDTVPLELDVKHPEEPLRGTGEAALKMARFNVPARNVTWTVLEPEGVRMWGWRGSFADAAPPPDMFLQRFAIGLWSAAGNALLALFEPSAMSLILLVLLGVTLARSAALGRMPLDASLGQFAFIGFVIVLGAIFVHVLTSAANPGPSLADTRAARIDRIEDGGPRPPAPPAAAPRSPIEEPRDARRALLEDASNPLPPRAEPVPAPGAAPAPAPGPVVPTPPLIRATSVEPSGTSLAGPTSDSAVQMSAAPVHVTPAAGAPASTPAPAPVPEGRSVFARAVVLPSEGPLTLDASYVERRWESLGTAAGMLIGILMFMAVFMSVRQLLDGGTTNMIAGLGLLILWLLDMKFPFTGIYAAAGFGIPVLLLGSVKVMGHALDMWDAWREEGERFNARSGTESRGSSETRGGNWSASFPRSGDRNEVAIKEIFAETPQSATAAASASPAAASAAADEISFVSEDDEEAADESRGGERE